MRIVTFLLSFAILAAHPAFLARNAFGENQSSLNGKATKFQVRVVGGGWIRGEISEKKLKVGGQELKIVRQPEASIAENRSSIGNGSVSPAATDTTEKPRTWPIVLTNAAMTISLLFIQSAEWKGKVTGIAGALTGIFAFRFQKKQETHTFVLADGRIVEIRVNDRNRMQIYDALYF